MSALLLVLVGVGVYAGIDGPAATSASNQQRSVAATLAEQDQDTLRAMPVTSLSNYEKRYTKQVCSDGTSPPCGSGIQIDYTIASSARWASDSSGSLACGGSSTADYLKLTSTVTWQSHGIVKPVTVESIHAPPPSSFSGNTGNLSVLLEDQNQTPDPAVGVPVTVNQIGSPTLNTNSQGCAFFGYLPVGTYNITYAQPGYVDPSGNTSISANQSVSQGNTTLLQQSYAPAGQIAIGSETLLQGQTQPTPAQAAYVSVANTGIPAQTRAFGTGTAQSTITAANLFPFPNGYGVYAGQCPGDNPVNGNSSYYAQNPGAMVTVAPGGSYSATVYMPAINIAVTRGGAALANADVTVHQTAASCAGLDVYPRFTTNAQGALPNPAFPFGTYTVCADDGRNKVTATVNNTTNNGTATVTLPIPTAGNSGVCA